MLTLTYNYRRARFQDYNKAQYACIKEIFRNECNWKFILYVALYVIVCCENNIKLYKIRRGMYIYKNYLNKYHYLKIWSSGTKEGIFFQNGLIIISYLNSMHLQILSPHPTPLKLLSYLFIIQEKKQYIYDKSIWIFFIYSIFFFLHWNKYFIQTTFLNTVNIL